jgi:hypothetical protein
MVLALLVAMAVASTRPAADEGSAVARARAALEARYFLDVDLGAMDPQAEQAPDGRWTVTFSYHGRPCFRVTVLPPTPSSLQPSASSLESPVFLDGERAAGTPGAAVEWARAYLPLAVYLDGHRTALLDARYEVRRRRWRVAVVVDGVVTGAVWVAHGQALVGQGPWEPTAEEETGSLSRRLAETWNEIRPVISPRTWQYLYAAAFLALFVSWRRLRSWRTVDALALTALLPAGLATLSWPAPAYAALWLISAYLFTRLLVHGLRSARTPPLPPSAPPSNPLTGVHPRGGSAACGAVTGGAGGGRRTVALVVLLLAALVHQGVVFPAADWRSCDYAGLFGGDYLFTRGSIPYGQWGYYGFDTYGPVHYLLYGLGAKAYPPGVGFGEFRPETKQPAPRMTGAAVLLRGFLVLTAAALALIGRRLTRQWAPGLQLAVGFCLLSPALGRFVGGAHVIPGCLILLALVAYPNPYLSASAMGLATGTLWFPVFLAPLWLGAFRGRRGATARFALALAAVLALVVAGTFLGAPSVGARLAQFREVVLARQEPVFKAEFEGGSAGVEWLPWWSPSAVRPYLAGGYALVCAVFFVWPRRKGWFALAALTAAVVVGTQLWKDTHRGEYVAWYLPALLPALFLRAEGNRWRKADESRSS